MALSPLSDVASQFRRIDPWEQTPSYAPTPGNFGHEHTPSRYSPSPNHGNRRSTPLRHTSPAQQNFIQGSEWDYGRADGEDQPTFIQYMIEWRVTLNNRVVAKDTEQDLALTPRSYWQDIKQKAENVLCRKIARNRRVRLDDTTVVVSVNDRSQRDLTKRFERTDIDWTAIQRQLMLWETLFHQGKKLRLCISINYLDSDESSSGTDKRGQTSVTRRMLNAREAEIDAEQCSGQPSAWRDVYRVMRCPGAPCRLDSQYCWQDPSGKKHYKLRTHHLRKLVRYVEKEGGVIETHDDVPDTIREQLYAEEQQRLERRQKAPGHPATASTAPININILPAQPSQPVTVTSSANADIASPRTSPNKTIEIPGPLEVAVEEYTAWQLSRVSTESFRENVRKARDVTLENCLDLKQIYYDQDPNFFIGQGVKIGVARRFVSEISDWVKEYELNRNV